MNTTKKIESTPPSSTSTPTRMIASFTTANIKELIAVLKTREGNEEALVSLHVELAKRKAEHSLKRYREQQSYAAYLAYAHKRAEIAHRHEICSYYDTCDCEDCM